MKTQKSPAKQKRRCSDSDEINIICPYCETYKLWVYYQPPGVYLACSNPEHYGCQDATEICANVAQAKARAAVLVEDIKEKRAELARIKGRIQLDLFGTAIAVPIERIGFKRGFGSGEPKGYAAKPGTGPADKTCNQCEHFKKPWGIPKCGLLEKTWTHGKATDINARALSCIHFKGKP